MFEGQRPQGVVGESRAQRPRDEVLKHRLPFARVRGSNSKDAGFTGRSCPGTESCVVVAINKPMYTYRLIYAVYMSM